MEINKEESLIILEILGKIQISLSIKELDSIDKIKEAPIFLLKDRLETFIREEKEIN